jgi:protein-S-isoprenylcysteine O-methyltransferase Ste14
MPNGSIRAYRPIMMPEWLDYDRVQALLALIAILAVLTALIALAMKWRPTLRVLAVVVLGVVAAAAIWQTHEIDADRRTDCNTVEVLGARVAVPGCPNPQT